MLRLEQLENRECPAFLGVRDGWVISPDGRDYQPFPDFPKAHASAGDRFVTVVTAAPGGGPRMQVRDGDAITADRMVFEDSFRGGVNVAYDRGIIAVAAEKGGGPVVGVYDTLGNELARFFAYDPAFRGGVSVAIHNGTIFTVPGEGGGPHVRAFDFHGTPVDADFFGDNPARRDGWDLIVGDVTHDRLADVVLATRTGRVSITDGATGYRAAFTLPPGYTRAGWEGETLTVGNEADFHRGRAVLTYFDAMAELEGTDGAAGNPNPPPTTGTRPGVYNPISISGSPPSLFENLTTFGQIDVSDSVGTPAVGTGSSYVPMQNAAGETVIVTASHVARRSPFTGVANMGALTAPGRLDGVPELAGFPVVASRIEAGTPYTVDAAAFRPVDGVVLGNEVVFGSQSMQIDGVAESVQPGDVLISVGRGDFVGVGTADGYQESTAAIRWPSGEVVEIVGQLVGLNGVVPLAVPGFSGGVVLRITWLPDDSEDDFLVELVGMVVAGNAYVVFVTPHALIESAIGLKYRG